jgi:ectoine hydroxylase-related dioxygenase (phytanoyl-CoA dioxygenase family)
MARYTAPEHDAYAADFNRDGHVLLRGHYDPARVQAWADAFAPLLRAAIDDPTLAGERGPSRYYVTLPFEGVFADPHFFDDDDVLAIVERVAGADPVMCQLATDTPLKGSAYQDLHRDTPPLFAEEPALEPPSYQLAVNFPLCRVTLDNGPLETAAGTHRLTRDEALAAVADGRLPLQAVTMELGDVLIRDVRQIHRGTPNPSDEPRPMVVIGYSRRWYHRPEVHIDVPRAVLEGLSPRARRLLRFNPVCESLADVQRGEGYQAFAY